MDYIAKVSAYLVNSGVVSPKEQAVYGRSQPSNQDFVSILPTLLGKGLTIGVKE